MIDKDCTCIWLILHLLVECSFVGRKNIKNTIKLLKMRNKKSEQALT